MFSRNLYAQHPVTKDLLISPRFSPTFFLSRCKFSTLTSTRLYSSINIIRRLYSWNPVFEIVHQESMKKVFLTHLQRKCSAEPLCAASCGTKDIPISPRFSPTIFYRRANSALYSGQFLIHSNQIDAPCRLEPHEPRDVFCCVFFPSILDIKFVGRTSRGHTGGRSHRIFNTPSFCGACLAFCREKDSAIPFPRRP